MRTAGCVLYLLKWYTDPLEGLKAAVKMGGFVDSLAAVVLGTLGSPPALPSFSRSSHPHPWPQFQERGTGWRGSTQTSSERWSAAKSCKPWARPTASSSRASTPDHSQSDTAK